ncbi:hypothetical protein HDE68_004905 [Pedobacter cryoconitis]|uniref:YXWGXW repeat-containing protein n=1 Tax=Pedobacter cryoconitis TaxID=188932 RepID=A0A7W8ZRP3_9SPHI|nr:YXWGXW repeat-containing protein [Pedobacter cryoconitis]MBB5638967.1 hypothetical protein [Pedobacter cryoconitis]
MKKNQPGFLRKLFLKNAITASLLMILSFICLFSISSAFGQDNGNYTDDQASVTIKTQQAPPPLPDYVQPECPGDGYIWTPGYWSWATDDYYWVPGVWILPPGVSLLWTPGYWGFYDSFYGWHPGYWGAQVGYYGGINYGFGYFGSGFYGGRWEGGHFMYNTSVWRVGKNIHNTYVNKVNININNRNRASFNGRGGINYRPGRDEMRGVQNHISASKEQTAHEVNMGNEKGQFHHTNPKPAIHSMSAPGGHRFDERGHEMRMGVGMQGGGGGRRGRG